MTFSTYNRQVDGFIIDCVRSIGELSYVRDLIAFGQAVDGRFDDINDWIADRRCAVLDCDIVQAIAIAVAESTSPLRDEPAIAIRFMARVVRRVYEQIVEMLDIAWFIVSVLACLVMVFVPEWTDSDMAEYIHQSELHDLAVDRQNAIALSELESVVAAQIEEIHQQTALEIMEIQASTHQIDPDLMDLDVSDLAAINAFAPQPESVKPNFFTMNMPALKQWASEHGISNEQVRVYGTLREKKTWRRALNALVV